MSFPEIVELLGPEDLPVSEEDRKVLRRLRQFTPEEIFAGIQALAEAYPFLAARAGERPTFAGRTPFALPVTKKDRRSSS